jgi:hypothetical protein
VANAYDLLQFPNPTPRPKQFGAEHLHLGLDGRKLTFCALPGQCVGSPKVPLAGFFGFPLLAQTFFLDPSREEALPSFALISFLLQGRD